MPSATALVPSISRASCSQQSKHVMQKKACESDKTVTKGEKLKMLKTFKNHCESNIYLGIERLGHYNSSRPFSFIYFCSRPYPKIWRMINRKITTTPKEDCKLKRNCIPNELQKDLRSYQWVFRHAVRYRSCLLIGSKLSSRYRSCLL